MFIANTALINEMLEHFTVKFVQLDDSDNAIIKESRATFVRQEGARRSSDVFLIMDSSVNRIATNPLFLA